MCKSAEEGGIRCAAHTRPIFEAAMEQMGERATSPRTYKDTRLAWEVSDEGMEIFDAIVEHATTPAGNKEVAAKAAELLRVNGQVNLFSHFMRRAVIRGEELAADRKEREADYKKAVKAVKAKLYGHRGGGAGTGSVEKLKPSVTATPENNMTTTFPGVEEYWKAEDNDGIGPEQCTHGSNGQLNYRCAECKALVSQPNFRVNSLSSTLRAGRLPFCDSCKPERVARFNKTQNELATLTSVLGDDPEAFNALSPATQYALLQKMGLIKGSQDSMNRSIAMSIVHGDLTLKDVVAAQDLRDIDGRLREDLDDTSDLTIAGDIDIAGDDSTYTPTVAKIDQALASTGVLALVDEESELAKTIAREANETLWERAYKADDIDEYVEFINSRYGFTPQGDAALDRFNAELATVRARPLPEGYAVERFDKYGNPVVMEPTLAQQRFAEMVEDRRRVMNWSGTGAGKTLAATLAVQGAEARETLIVCPKAVVDQWENEFKQGFPDNTDVRIGLPKDGVDLPPPPPGVNRVWIANYEKFQGDNAGRDKAITALADRVDAVVYDEIHMAKASDNAARSQRSERLEKFTDRAGRKNENLVVIGASATPVVNDLSEAKSVLRLVEGPTSKGFQTKPTLKNAAAAHQRLAAAGVRHMPEYSNIKMEREDVDVDVTPHVANIQATINKYRQESKTPNAPVNAAMMEKALLPYKMPKIIDNVKANREANNGPTLVYTDYTTGMVDTMRKGLEAEGLRVGTFTGYENDADRKDALKKFQAGEIDVLIGSRPVATGVDGLQNSSSNLIVASMAWTAAQDDQMVGRLMRRGQTKNVKVSYILTEAKVGESRWSWCKDNRQKRVHFKRDMANAAVDGVLPDGALDSKQDGAEKALSGLKDIAAALAHQNNAAAA
jgi:superfamily II DNA or RNA helicase